MNARLSQALDREVSRKEFLALTGMAIASVMGFGGIFKLLIGHEPHTTSSATSTRGLHAQDYNAGPYGG